MNLSLRLLTLAKMVPSDYPCADIGADHGYLVSYLLEHKIVDRCFASDNKKGPFLRLNDNLKKYIELGQVKTSLSDGLDDLTSEYKTIIIAGMGGELIEKILNDNFKKLDQIEYILLAPHGRESQLRKFLTQNNFQIIDENVVFDGHFYELILFKKGRSKYTDFELEYGPINLIKKDPIFIKKYQSRITKNKELLVNNLLSDKRKDEINNQINQDQNMLIEIEKSN